MAAISEQEVTHIAKLARIRLTPDETKKMTQELGSILTYIDQLQGVDTSGIEATAQVGVDAVRVREDVAKNYGRADDLLAAAPDRVGRLIKTKAVLRAHPIPPDLAENRPASAAPGSPELGVSPNTPRSASPVSLDAESVSAQKRVLGWALIK